MTIREFIKKHEIFWYVIVCYLIAILATSIQILLQIPFVNLGNWTLSNAILFLLYVFSPTISAILIKYIIGGTNEVGKFLKGYTIWRVPFIWYFAALILLLLPLAIGIIISLAGLSQGNGFNQTANMVLYLIGFGLLSGPIPEEGGWRGLLLPKLEAKHNALVSSLILGVIWFLWHIPLFFIPGTNQYEMLQYGIVSAIIGSSIYFVLVMSIGLIMTWLYNNTKGSLIITILAHYCFNFGSTLVITILGILSSNQYNMIGGVLGVLYLGIIFVFFGFRKFSRKSDEEMPFVKEKQ
jgi:membrane protease YdiL (CAAX protease family)